MTRPTVRGKWLLFGGITVLVAVAAGAIVVWRQSAKPVKPAAPVAVIPPVMFDGNEVSLQGRIRARKVVTVGAPIDGLIDNLFVEEGQEVYEGQLLGRIRNGKLESEQESANLELEKVQGRLQTLEASQLAARLEASRATAEAQRAKSDLDRAERGYQRQASLMKEGATPRLQFEKADRDYKNARTDFENLDAVGRAAEDRVAANAREIDRQRQVLSDRAKATEEAKDAVGEGEMTSPTDGLVIARKGSPGDQVTVGGNTDMVQIAVDTTSLEVVLEPPPPVLARIKPGQMAAVRIAERIGEALAGGVARVEGTQVVVQFLSPSTAIKPGLTAQVTIRLN